MNDLLSPRQGVIGRLAKLTSCTQENKNKWINELYPKHAEALSQASLAPECYPTLEEALAESEEKAKEQALKEETESCRQNQRQVFFCIGKSNLWKEPIHKTLKSLRDKHNLKWLRISMSYHHFSNL